MGTSTNVEVREGISNLIPHFIMNVVTVLLGLHLDHVCKRGSRSIECVFWLSRQKWSHYGGAVLLATLPTFDTWVSLVILPILGVERTSYISQAYNGWKKNKIHHKTGIKKRCRGGSVVILMHALTITAIYHFVEQCHYISISSFPVTPNTRQHIEKNTMSLSI